ncbi:CPBP family intramembrane glutamic endopeptidase [Paenibacillus sp. FSL K6-2862]|uniref:CPBP family intramembrane glutamic endopeptidase n=1 Tax=Paenibacillus sp. FSL K6-2862 TaxID=2921484 RepID=UPI0030F910FA
MRKEYSKKDEFVTGLILLGLSLSLTGCLIYWYFGNPEEFIERRLGINPESFNNPYVWILALIIAAGYIVYTAKVIPFVRAHLTTFSWLKVIGIWAALVSSTVEEILFRHVLMDWFNELELSIVIQVLASGIIFGIAHGAWIMLRGEFRIALPVILSTAVLGCLLAVLYVIADRNVLAPIIAHILINVMIEPWLMLSAVTGKWDSEEATSRSI